MRESFRKRVKDGEKLIGTLISLDSPAVAEILAAVGFDWLFIDEEHAPLATGDIQALLQASGDVPCVVRVAAPEELPIKKALDVGARGVIVPGVNSAEQAERVVSYARYSPEGSRGVGVARAHGYGYSFGEYVDFANEDIAVVVQAEHVKAVENIDAIVQVPGVDAVLIGPYDLSASLGKMGQVDDPTVLQAIDHVTTTCLEAGKTLGIFGVTAAAVLPYVARGFTFIVVGVDTMLLSHAAGGMLKEMRSSLEEGE